MPFISEFKKIIPSPELRWFWILLGIFFKASIFILLLNEIPMGEIAGFFGGTSVDSKSYIDPINNLLLTGNYMPDFRMPGLMIPYLIFRLFMNEGAACNATAIFQMVLAGISVYYLARTVLFITQSFFLFYTVYFLFLISTYSNIYDRYLLTDSLCTSASIFFFYFLVRYIKEKKGSLLLIAGALFTWILFLRQVYVFYFIAAFVVVILLSDFRSERTKLVKHMLLFLLPVLIFEGAWVIRNYNRYDEVILLRKKIFYEEGPEEFTEPLSLFVKSWGGDFIYWNPKAEIRWFNFNKSAINDLGIKPDIPDYIYTSAYNKDSLYALRSQITMAQADSTSKSDKIILAGVIREKCERYTRSVKEEKPYLYYIGAGCILLKKFLSQSGTYNLFGKPFPELSKGKKAVKIFYSGMYVLVVSFSLLGLFIYPNSMVKFILFFPVVYTLLIFPFGFKFSEYRYLVPAYPFMLAGAVLTVHTINSRFISLKR